MKLSRSSVHSTGGFSVAEMVVAVAIATLLGLVFFQVLQSGLTLAAKNTAVNAAHEEARQGMLRLTRDIHSAISVPQLRDTSYAVVSSTPSPSASPGATPPTAAGVSFQVVGGGPNYIFQDPGGASGLVMINDAGGAPVPGMRIIIPGWAIEDDIIKVSGASVASHSNVFTTKGFETGVKKTPAYAGSFYAITYYTKRMMYLVQNGTFVADAKGDHNLVSGQYVQVAPGTGQYRYQGGELHYYEQRTTSTNPSVAGTLIWKDVATVARNLTSPKPFSVPLNRRGGPDNKYVKVQISAQDPRSSNRGYLSTSALLDTQIDYRSRLTIFQ